MPILFEVCILTIGAFLLRFYRLGFHSLWLDEIVTVRDAMHPFKEIPSVIASYPPVWAYITRVFFLVFGRSDFWLRVPPAIFGALTVPVIWWVAKRFFGNRAAFWAGLLAAVSVFDVFYSQEIRMYTLVAFEALVSMAFWTEAVEKGDKKAWVGYGVATLLGLYTHNWFPFLVFAQGVWFAGMSISRRSIDRWGFAAFCGITIIYFPWLFVLKRQLALPVYGHLHAPGLKDIRETFYAYAGIRVPSGDSWQGIGADARMPLLLVSLAFLAWGLVSPGESRQRSIRLFFVGCFIPVSMAFVISVLDRPIYLPGRYTILGLPAYLLTVARGFEEVPLKWRRMTAFFGALWVALSLYAIGRYYWIYLKAPWKEACQWIDRQSPEPLIINLDIRAPYAAWFFEYYLTSRKINEDSSRNSSVDEPIYTLVNEAQMRDPIVLPPWQVTDSKVIGSLHIYKTERSLTPMRGE